MQGGELIAGRYELQRELGEGGSATVWLARDRTLERPVAIKFVEIDDARQSARLTEQFLREARIAGAVHHRNVIQILDFGVHEGAPFMAMEALSGETMADRFDSSQRFELREVIEIAARCLEGLAAVHAAGIVHRDLKPENIFLVREPTGVYPKLLDFGISKTVDKREGRRSAVPTEAGRVVGTPEYMSPEQARGMTDLDLRTDLYSLGVVMYEAVTGRLPYDAPHMGDVLIKVVAGGAPEVARSMPAVGWPISEVISRAMQGDRELRFANAMEMRTALLAAAQPLFAGSADPIALPPSRGRGQRNLESQVLTRESAMPLDAQRAVAALTSARDRGTRPPAWLLLGGGVIAAMLIAAVTLALGGLRGRGGEPPERQYIVVQGAQAATSPAPAPPLVTTIAASGSIPSAAAAEAVPSPPAQAAADRARRRPQATERPAAPPAVPTDALARAFDRQKARVVQCLNEHADQTTERVQMSVRLSLDLAGRVQAAEMLPLAIAATPVGACIAAAVREMRFDPQAAPISFRVPLLAKRSAATP